jgi:hypothetical protein
MSYSRNYSTTISGTVSDSFDYPASESGGSKHVSMHWSEDVHIEIGVDTSSFDHGVGRLKGHIDVLTGAVVTTEAAQIEEKVRGAAAIGDCVTKGFFDLVRSEITQQTAALKSRVDSLVLKLNDMKLACLRVRQTMQQDYARITDRYSSTFAELDRELAKRIAALDETAYVLAREASAQESRSYDSTLSTIPTVFAAEISQAQGILLAAAVRAQMNSLLQGAVAYLASEKKTAVVTSDMLLDQGASNAAATSVPVAFLKADELSAVPSERLIVPATPAVLAKDPILQGRVIERFHQHDLEWKPLSQGHRSQIERFLIPLLDGIQTQAPNHDARVRQTIARLWSPHSPETLSL